MNTKFIRSKKHYGEFEAVIGSVVWRAEKVSKTYGQWRGFSSNGVFNAPTLKDLAEKISKNSAA